MIPFLSTDESKEEMGQTESHVIHPGESSDGIDRVELYKHFTCQPPKDHHQNHVDHLNHHADHHGSITCHTDTSLSLTDDAPANALALTLE